MALKKSKVKFPCGECKRAVRGDSISCDKCSTWYHKDCIHMGDPIFDSYTLNESLEGECTHCALSNISSSIFNSTVSNDTSADKPKSLRVSVCNFQSIWNKRAILSTFLSENDIDMLIGCETHLTKDILNSEILPSNYIATRKDRDDGFGGIAIIYKNNIMVEDIHFDWKSIFPRFEQTFSGTF